MAIPEGLTVGRSSTGWPRAPTSRRPSSRRRSGPDALGLPAYAEGNPEGYLFPATYAFGPEEQPADMLHAMVARWQQAAEDNDLEAAAQALGYTPHEMMTIASLIEAEGRGEVPPKIARVIYNRLENPDNGLTNGLLEIDATVNYALGRDDLGVALTAEDLEVDSPYNTRKYPGLPPGPIEAPGDDSIQAALHPADGPWLFYVTVNLDDRRDQVHRRLRRVPPVQGRVPGVLRDPVRPLLTGRSSDVRCAVLGDPIDHSLSPVLHRAAYDALGLDWQYDAVRVAGRRARRVPRRARPALARAVADHAAQAGGGAAARLARRLGGARPAPATRWCSAGRQPARADNTDVTGALMALGERTTARSSGPSCSAGERPPRRCCWRWPSAGCGTRRCVVRDPDRAAETLRGGRRRTASAPEVEVRTSRMAPVVAVGRRRGLHRPRRPPRCPTCWPLSPRSRSSSTWSTTRGRRRWPPPPSGPAGPWSAASTCWWPRRSTRWSR